MNINELQEVYRNNIQRAFNANNFMEIASHSSNIQGYSLMNRILIYVQNKLCTEVKSSISWELEGRKLKKDAVAIGVLTPVTKTTYVETDTQREVKALELSIEEFNKAIVIGVITKQVEVIDIKCSLVYDISETVELDGYNRVKPKADRKIKISTLLELLESIGVVVKKGIEQETAFDMKSNTFIIGNDKLYDKIVKCIDTLVVKYIEQCILDIELTDDEIKLVREYAIYSTLTYFNIDTSIKFEYIQSIYDEYTLTDGKIDNIISLLDDIEYMLSSKVLSSGSLYSSCIVDEGHKTYVAHKASILLAIIEANYGMNIIKEV